MMGVPLRGPWDGETIARFLGESLIPLRLACLGQGGHPVVASHWFVAEGDVLLCATQSDSHVASLLGRDRRCGFEVASEQPPYRGLRGQAVAELDAARGAAVLERLIQRYGMEERGGLAAWLRQRSHRETAIVLHPRSLSSWDYSERMGSKEAE